MAFFEQFPELQGRVVDESVYRTVVTENPDLNHYAVENIATAFALSSLRSYQRRHVRRQLEPIATVVAWVLILAMCAWTAYMIVVAATN